MSLGGAGVREGAYAERRGRFFTATYSEVAASPTRRSHLNCAALTRANLARSSRSPQAIVPRALTYACNWSRVAHQLR